MLQALIASALQTLLYFIGICHMQNRYRVLLLTDIAYI
jgi:hypothetical protein